MPAKHKQTKIHTHKKVWGNNSARRHCSSTHNNEDSTFFKSAYPKEQNHTESKTKQIREEQNHTETKSNYNQRKAKSYRNLFIYC
jgi:hypothetical protein